MLRRIFGPKMEEVTGERRKAYEELQNCIGPGLHVIRDRRMKSAAHVQ
jgi:hypothetical protein